MRTITPWMLAMILATTITHTVCAKLAKSPTIGDAAPAIEGKDQNGDSFKLADVLNKRIVLLYFYPKDNTPGCTKQACGLRDRMENLKRDGVEVIGVSFDSVDSHKQFVQQHNLNFRLLADPEGKIADAFGARRAEGATMTRRISFLIGLDGKIAHVTDSPSADTHLAQMKDAIAKLKK